MLVFEFFSGIGGMHVALKQANCEVAQIFPFDINPNANKVYLDNFDVKPYELTIQSFSIEDYEKLTKNNDKKILWTMSPPCQPFTRQGLCKDIEDNRSDGFIYL